MATVALLPLPRPWTRSWSISQRVLPFFSGSGISDSKDGRDHARDDVTKAQDETADDDGHGQIAFIDEIVEIQLGSELVEHFVAHHYQQNGQESKGRGGDEVSEEIVG